MADGGQMLKHPAVAVAAGAAATAAGAATQLYLAYDRQYLSSEQFEAL